MYISHKSNVIQSVEEVEWQCRRVAKGMTIDEYWAWIDTITTDGVVDYSGETGYTIVRCTDEDVEARLSQLSDYHAEGVYNIKYYASKRDSEILIAENVEDEDGNPVAKVYLQSHFIPDNTSKDKRLLNKEWTNIRRERTRLLAETDHHALSDQTLSADMKTYRTKLRDLPSDQSSKTKYSDITWPTKP